MKKQKNVKRLNFFMPIEMNNKLKDIAKKQSIPVSYLLQKFIKLGFIIFDAENDSNKSIIIKEKDEETKIMFL